MPMIQGLLGRCDLESLTAKFLPRKTSLATILPCRHNKNNESFSGIQHLPANGSSALQEYKHDTKPKHAVFAGFALLLRSLLLKARGNDGVDTQEGPRRRDG